MPTGRETRRLTSRRWLYSAGAVLLACGLSAGCKSSKVSGGGGALASRTNDPLMGGARIPPQDIPIPGRDSYGASGRRDPLLDGGKPAVRGEKTDRTEGNPPKRGDTAALARPSRSPYRPSRSVTPASLAGRIATDDEDLSIGLRPSALPDGPVPLRPRDDSARTGGLSYDEIVHELRQYDATWDPPTRDPETDQYVFGCNVPIAGVADGRVRRYEGSGPTPAAAAKHALDQIREYYTTGR